MHVTIELLYTMYIATGVSKTRNETKRNETKRNSPIPVTNFSGRGVGVYGAIIDSSFIYSLPLERAGNCITGMLDTQQESSSCPRVSKLGYCLERNTISQVLDTGLFT